MTERNLIVPQIADRALAIIRSVFRTVVTFGLAAFFPARLYSKIEAGGKTGVYWSLGSLVGLATIQAAFGVLSERYQDRAASLVLQDPEARSSLISMASRRVPEGLSAGDARREIDLMMYDAWQATSTTVAISLPLISTCLVLLTLLLWRRTPGGKASSHLAVVPLLACICVGTGLKLLTSTSDLTILFTVSAVYFVTAIRAPNRNSEGKLGDTLARTLILTGFFAAATYISIFVVDFIAVTVGALSIAIRPY
ncbi:hypothetical protein [Maricaulis sp.]|uniref:hypothetical protein n=1 Tax=Maricaulis sp. TaxID=1486257 RepID=UPI001B06EC64|nr:hypothetical protein [Maricaulis sp.]MBO6797083.1 hypothetical protein [Maricaulis sp.]